MRSIIKDGQVVQDSWVVLRPDEEGVLPAANDGQQVIVPLATWLSAPETWQQQQAGVWLAPDDDPSLLAPYVATIAVVAVDFPAFTDGRGYSLARLLRERLGFTGELRAIGDVWEDLVHYLWQVGFDAFQIKEGKALDSALKGYNVFTERYQATWRQPVPLFQRRVK